MDWLILAAVLGVPLLIVVLKHRKAGSASFNPDATLRRLLIRIEEGGSRLSASRKWDNETRAVSEGQVYGFLVKGILDACRATGTPLPQLGNHEKWALHLAEYPLLSTATAVYHYLVDVGEVPEALRPKHPRRGDSFEERMAELAHDAPIREALGLVAFRIEGINPLHR